MRRVLHALLRMSLLFINVTGQGSMPPCLEEGKTWHGDDILDVSTGSLSVYDCQSKCGEMSGCNSFTWYTLQHPHYPTLCTLFSSTKSQEPCTECVSGPSSCTCSGEYGCDITEEDVLDTIANIATELECMGLCFEDRDCNMYTWFGVGSTLEHVCFLFKNCYFYDYDCNDCFSGPPVCSSTTSVSSTTTATTSQWSSTTAENKNLFLFLDGNMILSLPSFADSGCQVAPPEHLYYPYGVAGTVTDSDGSSRLMVCFEWGCWLRGEDWIQNDSLNLRGRAASSGDGLGGWLVSGGYNDRMGYTDSTEIYKDGAWTAGPKLPSTLHDHCQVEVNGKVIITGGWNHGTINQTLVMEVDKWNSVASMKNGRYYHACVEFEGEAFVFGGTSTHNSRLASVEIYNLAEDSWRNGPDLPIALAGAQAVVHDDVIYVLGGDAGSHYSKQIFYLSGPDYNTWNVLSVELGNGRRVFTNPPILTNELMFC